MEEIRTDKEQVLQVIQELVTYKKEEKKGYCLHPIQMQLGTCDSDCDNCLQKYGENLLKKYIDKCFIK